MSTQATQGPVASTTVAPKPPIYCIVFEYTAQAGGYAGVRTWTAVADKAEFDRFFTEMGGKTENGQKIMGNQLVLAEGATKEEALALTRQTPASSYVGAAFEEATHPVTGEFNPEIARRHLMNAGLLLSSRQHPPASVSDRSFGDEIGWKNQEGM